MSHEVLFGKEEVAVFLDDKLLAMVKAHMKKCILCKACACCTFHNCLNAEALVELSVTPGKHNDPAR